jgi:hypothetical protein
LVGLAVARWGVGLMGLRGRILDGRYQLGSVGGIGGMARVDLAEDWLLRRQVAVKVLSPPMPRILCCGAVLLGGPHRGQVAPSQHRGGVRQRLDAEQHDLVMEEVAGQSLAELVAGQAGWCHGGWPSWPARWVRRWLPRPPRGWCTATSRWAVCWLVVVGW